MTLVISYLPFECLLSGSPLAIFWSSGKESGFYTEWGEGGGWSLLSHLASGDWANLGTSPNNRPLTTEQDLSEGLSTLGEHNFLLK